MKENANPPPAGSDDTSTVTDVSPAYLEGTTWNRTGRDGLAAKLADILLSENLIVLCGLGTSLCLRDPAFPDDPQRSRAPRMSDLWQSIEKEYTTNEDGTPNDKLLSSILATVKYSPDPGKENIEILLSHCQMFSQVDKNDEVSAFTQLAEKKIQEMCDFLLDDESLRWHKFFLLKVGRRSTRQPRMKLFTTNYDRCFEEAANQSKFLVIDGFTHTIPQVFDGNQFSYDFVKRDLEKDIPDYIPNVFHLYKLHGSIDWESQSEAKRYVIKSQKPSKPAMIFPRQGKFELSYQQPYFEMMSRFQSALRLPKTGLLILGFGFNDAHLSEPIRSALDSNVGLKCCVVNPGFSENVEKPDPSINSMLAYIERLVASGDRRILAVKATFEELVPVIPDLVTATEQERHESRIAQARKS